MSFEVHEEDNWVWSPQGEINMHAPERWGFVRFSTEPAGTPFVSSHAANYYRPRADHPKLRIVAGEERLVGPAAKRREKRESVES